MAPIDSSMFDKFGVTFKPNQVLFCEYEPGDDFYLIQSGQVRLTKVVGDTEKTLDILSSGEIFGEMAILEQQPRSATAIAVDEVKALNFNRQNFEMLMEGNPQLALKLLKIFSKRIFDAKRRLMILTLADDDARVADTLLMLAENRNVSFESQEPVELPHTYEEIASWCGLKPTRCQEVLNQFTSQGRISLYEDKIIVKNINELHRLIVSRRRASSMSEL